MFTKGNIPWSKGKKLVQQKIHIIQCNCGCGEKFNGYDSRNRLRRYLPFHYKSWILGNKKFFKNLCAVEMTDEIKKKISNTSKGIRRSPATEFKKGCQTRFKTGRVKRLKYIGIKSEPYKYTMEHRLVMEHHIGRKLNKEEQVHHINGITTDNRIENLQLFKNAKEHTLHHWKLKRENK